MELIKELGFKKLPTRTEFDKAAFGSCKVDGRGHVTLCSWVFEFMEFLQQKPELWMFVPTIKKDGVWVVLEKPELCTENIIKVEQYQEALDRVLFECKKDFDYSWLTGYLVTGNSNSYYIEYVCDIYTTLEEAVNNGIKLKLK